MMDRGEFGELYHRVIGKNAGREACREAWARWQAIEASGMTEMVLHPHEAPMPASAESDYYIVAKCGPLRFVARAAETFFLQLPDMWLQFSRGAELEKHLDRDPRSAARTFVHKSLVDGHGMNSVFGPAMAAGITWLIATSMAGELMSHYHLIGYDISYVPGPVGQARMFNFRAVLAPTKDSDAFDHARELPLPPWQPPSS